MMTHSAVVVVVVVVVVVTNDVTSLSLQLPSSDINSGDSILELGHSPFHHSTHRRDRLQRYTVHIYLSKDREDDMLLPVAKSIISANLKDISSSAYLAQTSMHTTYRIGFNEHIRHPDILYIKLFTLFIDSFLHIYMISITKSRFFKVQSKKF